MKALRLILFCVLFLFGLYECRGTDIYDPNGYVKYCSTLSISAIESHKSIDSCLEEEPTYFKLYGMRNSVAANITAIVSDFYSSITIPISNKPVFFNELNKVWWDVPLPTTIPQCYDIYTLNDLTDDVYKLFTPSTQLVQWPKSAKTDRNGNCIIHLALGQPFDYGEQTADWWWPRDTSPYLSGQYGATFRNYEMFAVFNENINYIPFYSSFWLWGHQEPNFRYNMGGDPNSLCWDDDMNYWYVLCPRVDFWSDEHAPEHSLSIHCGNRFGEGTSMPPIDLNSPSPVLPPYGYPYEQMGWNILVKDGNAPHWQKCPGSQIVTHYFEEPYGSFVTDYISSNWPFALIYDLNKSELPPVLLYYPDLIDQCTFLLKAYDKNGQIQSMQPIKFYEIYEDENIIRVISNYVYVVANVNGIFYDNYDNMYTCIAPARYEEGEDNGYIKVQLITSPQLRDYPNGLGDFNFDGKVDSQDYVMLIAHLGFCHNDLEYDILFDLNFDGCIDGNDLDLFLLYQGDIYPYNYNYYDLNHDHKVNLIDYALLFKNVQPSFRFMQLKLFQNSYLKE